LAVVAADFAPTRHTRRRFEPGLPDRKTLLEAIEKAGRKTPTADGEKGFS